LTIEPRVPPYRPDRTAKTRISDCVAVLNGDWNTNSNDAQEGQTDKPENLDIRYK